MKRMAKAIAMALCLAMMSVAPMGALAQSVPTDDGQVSEPRPEEVLVTEYVEPYWYYWPEEGGFDYSDGIADGTYVDFGLDEATGAITDYTMTVVEYNYFYPMVYYEDGRMGGGDEGYFPPDYNPEPIEHTLDLFESVTFDGFTPNGSPGVFGQSLVFLGENVMMTFTDYLQFGEENGTVVFTVPEGADISQTPAYYELYGIDDVDAEGYGYADSDSAYAPGGQGYMPWYAEWDEMYISTGNITTMLWVSYGTAEVSGNTITVHTYPGASISTSSWIEYGWEYEYQEPWFEDMPSEGDKGALESAMENGLMAAVGYLFMGDGGTQYDDARALNDPSFQLEFMNVEQDRFQVQVDSDIETGRIVTLNVNKDALDAGDIHDIEVLLDNEDVKACGSIEDLVDLQGGAEAGYYMVSGESQNTIFVYVPHFSTHIITVGLADSLMGGILLPGLLAVGFIATIVALAVIRQRRNRDEL